MQDASNPGVPKALANDNWYGYVNRVVVDEQVRWIEMAVVLPFWNNMVVYYVEGDRGHLMGEQIGGQRHRWGVRGNCFSYHMPWEDILRSLGRCVEDTELQAPLSQDVLVHLVRLHMKVGEAEWAKHLRQVKLRAHVALRLAYVLIDNKQPAFCNKGTAAELKIRFERVLREQYPDSGGDGKVPQRILEACKESLEGNTKEKYGQRQACHSRCRARLLGDSAGLHKAPRHLGREKFGQHRRRQRPTIECPQQLCGIKCPDGQSVNPATERKLCRHRLPVCVAVCRWWTGVPTAQRALASHGSRRSHGDSCSVRADDV